MRLSELNFAQRISLDFCSDYLAKPCRILSNDWSYFGDNLSESFEYARFAEHCEFPPDLSRRGAIQQCSAQCSDAARQD
jgi:hypothetical protein